MDCQEYHDDILVVNITLFKRYLTFIQENDYRIGNVRKLCEIAIEGEEPMTMDKQSRWLGYVQGVLFMGGLIDLEEERSISRNMYQAVYRKHGIKQDTLG